MKKRPENSLKNPLADGTPTPERAAAERLLAVEVRLHCAERQLGKVIDMMEKMLAAPPPAYRGRPELLRVK
jgi:hypothetical protein